MFFYRWRVTIQVRSVLDRSELRWAIVYVTATTPQRACGHRAVWEARNRVLENMTEGDWYVETSVVRDEEGERQEREARKEKELPKKTRRSAPLYDVPKAI